MTMLDTLRSVVRFGAVETDPRRTPAAPAPRRSPTCAASPAAGCPAACSTTSTAAAEDERTLAANEAAFAAIDVPPARAARHREGRHRVDDPRPARSRTRSCSRRPGSPASPIPTASSRSPAPRNGPACPYTLSTLSTRSIEEVRAVSDGRLWFQVYAWRDRGLVNEMIERAAAARLRGARAHGRHRGARPARARRAARLLAPADDRAAHDRRRRAAPRHGRGRSCAASRSASPTSSAATSATARRPSPSPTTSTPSSTRRSSWDDVEWLRSVWDGADRGQGHPDRRRRACSRPTRASTRSRCRTTAAASSTARPPRSRLVAPVADAVGGRTEIICDGGVRRGSDIVKAVAAGATACMAGRAYLYGARRRRASAASTACSTGSPPTCAAP